MDDETILRAYTSALTRRSASRTVCPSADVLRELATATQDAEHVSAPFEHVMSCAACLSEYEMLRAIHVTQRAPALAPVRRWSVMALAATVLLAVGVGTVRWSGVVPRGAETDVSRGAGSDVSVNAVAVINAATQVTRGDSLTLAWHSVPAADGYRVSLLNDRGDALHSTVVGDTTVTLSPGVLPANATDFTWLVAALRADGNERRSPLVRVTIAP